MTVMQLHARIAAGEHSRQQFKRTLQHIDAVAAELVAFSNSGGGTLLVGVNDDGGISGLDIAEVRRINQMLSNAASQHVHPPIGFLTENVLTEQGVVIVVTVADGIAKPYLDHQGRIWIKQGVDKRQLLAREEMQRMFQRAGLVYADIVPVTGTTSDDLDEGVFRQYLERFYSEESDLLERSLDAILQNLRLSDGCELNLAALLLFGRHPQRWRPVCSVKAVVFPGTKISDTRYLDSQDIGGTLYQQYTETLAFIKRNLHRVQGDQGFNSVGLLEIPEVALQELLVNALVHRDYFTSAPIRILIFKDRIDMISPGHLPDSLSLEDIRLGKTNRRNPMLAEHAFRILPYRGLGSGIPRALEKWPQIELISEITGNQFTARLQRPLPQWTTLREPDASLYGTSLMSPITPPVTPSLTPPVTPYMSRLLVLLAEHGSLGNHEIRQVFNLKDRRRLRETYLIPCLAAGLVEYTIPDKLNSCLQQYRLTALGQRWVPAVKQTL